MAWKGLGWASLGNGAGSQLDQGQNGGKFATARFDRSSVSSDRMETFARLDQMLTHDFHPVRPNIMAERRRPLVFPQIDSGLIRPDLSFPKVFHPR
jgi:hypothetical protein